MTQEELKHIIKGCVNTEKSSQRKLYRCFYRYGMNICNRYARSEEEAEEMLNDAFLRIFTKINMYNPDMSFSAWLHTIVVRSAINYLKKYTIPAPTEDLELATQLSFDDTIFSRLSVEEIIDFMRQLPISYRTVFNLAIVEGYSHVEIAALLGISEGTSRSNLMIARQKLQKMILQANHIRYGY